MWVLSPSATLHQPQGWQQPEQVHVCEEGPSLDGGLTEGKRRTPDHSSILKLYSGLLKLWGLQWTQWRLFISAQVGWMTGDKGEGRESSHFRKLPPWAQIEAKQSIERKDFNKEKLPSWFPYHAEKTYQSQLYSLSPRHLNIFVFEYNLIHKPKSLSLVKCAIKDIKFSKHLKGIDLSRWKSVPAKMWKWKKIL